MQKILTPTDLPIFCKCLIDGLNDNEEMCQLKTSELLNILFPIVAQQLHQKTYNEILSETLYLIYFHIFYIFLNVTSGILNTLFKFYLLMKIWKQVFYN